MPRGVRVKPVSAEPDTVIDIKHGRKPKDKAVGTSEHVIIQPPQFQTAAITITGVVPLVLHKFSAKARNTIIATQEEGQRAKKGRSREAKNFNEAYLGATYFSKEGWCGIPAAAFRNACIAACRLHGFKMTIAKMSIFCEADGFDKEDGTPLVKITKGEPKMHLAPARNSNGSTDIRARPMWEAGWQAVVRIRWDTKQFGSADVVNLLATVGLQVGVGEGRPDSRMSAGQGWGMFGVST